MTLEARRIGLRSLGLEKAGVEFVAADMPNANRLTVRLMAVIAQEEREMISARTKAALAAAKARGTKLGGNRGGPKVDFAKGIAARSRTADDYTPARSARWRLRHGRRRTATARPPPF